MDSVRFEFKFCDNALMLLLLIIRNAGFVNPEELLEELEEVVLQLIQGPRIGYCTVISL